MNEDRQIDIMGIVNLTDDSYFSPSRSTTSEDALTRISALLDEGADIIDIGACSTRPGADPVSMSEEWRRLAPVLKVLRNEYPDISISIDTFRSEIVSRAFDLIGPFMVNDISAGEDDPMMLQTVGSLGLEYVAMHKRGTPKTMSGLTDYQDIMSEIIRYFEDFSEKAYCFGIQDWILDPGFGFAKTVEQNYEILNNLDRFKPLGRRVLAGVSRKSMIYKYLGISPEESLPATQVLHLQALRKGADVLRVHDVAEARRTLSLYKILA